MGLIDLLKRIPLDLGQGSVADHTEGKQSSGGSRLDHVSAHDCPPAKST